MRFYPPTAPVPETLKTAEFTLRPLTPDHVELDHAALMISTKMLRLWSGHPEGGWPQDDFSVADNLKDMEWHYSDHLERTAFTFTVLTPAEDEVLGCIYIVPFAPLIEDNRHLGELIQGDAALIRFWAVEPRLTDGLDERLLSQLLAWLSKEWAFEQIFFHTFNQNTQQAATLERCGLHKVGPIDLGKRGGSHLLYRRQP